MEQALSDVYLLLSTLLAKEYTSDNLETIFKVSVYVLSGHLCF